MKIDINVVPSVFVIGFFFGLGFEMARSLINDVVEIIKAIIDKYERR